ncbi:hypothetical protein PM082_002940 [Marasmius tenuissimus]|nr:hypothetical protein PM082_002940 [Marasmius tenuissimus]
MARVRLPSFFSPCLVIFYLLWILGQLPSCSAGQQFTDGLSIINSPQAGSPGHAGSTLPISVEVSGNGKLPVDAAAPFCTYPTRFDSVEIYLVSSQTGKNYTVASGSDFLREGSGSVRQCNWQVPTCIPPGQYNLTFYEYAHINGGPYYTITSISIPIENPRPDSGGCTDGTNALQGQPQQSSPPSPPFYYSDGQGDQTRTSGWVTSNTGTGLPSPTVITTSVIITSGGLPTTVTQTVTIPSISISQVVSLSTITSVKEGVPTTFVQTTTAFVTVTPTGNPGDLVGLIPVNSGCIVHVTIMSLLTFLPLSIVWLLL